MKKMTFCFIVLLTVALGCTTLPVTKAIPTHEFRKTYDIWEEKEVATGNTMIEIVSAYYLQAYRIPTEYFPRKLPPITPDQQWVARHVIGENYILTTNERIYDRILGIEVKPNGELAGKKPWIQLTDRTRPVQDSWKKPAPQKFMPTEEYVLHDGYFRAELIYSGISESNISILYREFFNYKNRPRFHEELKYNIGQSDEIVFRSLRVRILGANNSKIRFQVLDDGGLPWVPAD